MPRFNVEVLHDLHVATAAEKLRSFSSKIRSDSSIPVSEVREEWDLDGNLDFSFKALGFSVSGRLDNRPGSVQISGSIPFTALPFRGRIENEIAIKVREALA